MRAVGKSEIYPSRASLCERKKKPVLRTGHCTTGCRRHSTGMCLFPYVSKINEGEKIDATAVLPTKSLQQGNRDNVVSRCFEPSQPQKKLHQDWKQKSIYLLVITHTHAKKVVKLQNSSKFRRTADGGNTDTHIYTSLSHTTPSYINALLFPNWVTYVNLMTVHL